MIWVRIILHLFEMIELLEMLEHENSLFAPLYAQTVEERSCTSACHGDEVLPFARVVIWNSMRSETYARFN